MKPRVLDERKRLGSAIHTEATRQKILGEDYCAFIRAAVGKSSSKECTLEELRRALRAFKGGLPAGRPGRARQAEGAIPGKVRALALSLWNLGAWPSDKAPDDAALRGFVCRQAKVDDLRFLTPELASSVIEALRAMCARAGFPVPAQVTASRARQLQIRAQFARLEALDAEAAAPFAWVRSGFEGRSERDLQHAVYAMGEQIRARMASQGEGGGND